MTDGSVPKIGGILLAAGGSTRFGRPKQLAEFRGATLLRRSAASMAASVCKPVVAVLGADLTQHQASIADLRLDVCINDNWQLGISTSIRIGLEGLISIEPGIHAVLITLCDQPLIEAKHIDLLVNRFALGRAPIVAAEYGEAIGVPAVFAREYFDGLLCLVGDNGARQIIRRNPENVAAVPMPEAAFDVDRPEDLIEINQK